MEKKGIKLLPGSDYEIPIGALRNIWRQAGWI